MAVNLSKCSMTFSIKGSADITVETINGGMVGLRISQYPAFSVDALPQEVVMLLPKGEAQDMFTAIIDFIGVDRAELDQ